MGYEYIVGSLDAPPTEGVWDNYFAENAQYKPPMGAIHPWQAGMVQHQATLRRQYAQQWRPRIESLLHRELHDPGVSILEIGSGLGDFAQYLAGKYATAITQTEVEPTMVGQIQQVPHGPLPQQLDVNWLFGIQNRSFDAIVSLNVLDVLTPEAFARLVGHSCFILRGVSKIIHISDISPLINTVCGELLATGRLPIWQYYGGRIGNTDRKCWSVPVSTLKSDNFLCKVPGYREVILGYCADPFGIHGNIENLTEAMRRLNDCFKELRQVGADLQKHNPHEIMSRRLERILEAYGYGVQFEALDLDPVRGMATIATKK